MAATKPRLFDCFTYNGEQELLSLRMEVLRGVVDYVVIAEATRTFTGKPKPLRFDRSLLPPDGPEVIYLPVDDLEPNPVSAWSNENHQRNALGRIVAGAFPQVAGGVRADDWIMLSDVDEIPHPDRIRAFRPEHYRSAVLLQRNFFYAFNNKAVRADGTDLLWDRARVTTVAHFTNWFETMQRLRDYRSHGPLRGLRRAWNKLRTQRVDNAGWHFSYLMTPEQIIEKLGSFSHQEFNTREIASVDYIRKCMEEGRDLFGSGRFRVVPLDDSFPAALVRQQSRYAQFVWDEAQAPTRLRPMP
jgi:beta-1,4-mannosyl-glycoprotein beta-1,4-N-acetylglucosaminyltransferase